MKESYRDIISRQLTSEEGTQEPPAQRRGDDEQAFLYEEMQARLGEETPSSFEEQALAVATRMSAGEEVERPLEDFEKADFDEVAIRRKSLAISTPSPAAKTQTPPEQPAPETPQQRAEKLPPNTEHLFDLDPEMKKTFFKKAEKLAQDAQELSEIARVIKALERQGIVEEQEKKKDNDTTTTPSDETSPITPVEVLPHDDDKPEGYDPLLDPEAMAKAMEDFEEDDEEGIDITPEESHETPESEEKHLPALIGLEHLPEEEAPESRETLPALIGLEHLPEDERGKESGTERGPINFEQFEGLAEEILQEEVAQGEKEPSWIREKIEAFGGWYNKQPLRYKLLTAGGLIAAAAAGGTAGGVVGLTIAGVATTGATVQRAMGVMATFITVEALLQRSHEKKTGDERTRATAMRHTAEAAFLAGVVGGAWSGISDLIDAGKEALSSAGEAGLSEEMRSRVNELLGTETGAGAPTPSPETTPSNITESVSESSQFIPQETFATAIDASGPTTESVAPTITPETASNTFIHPVEKGDTLWNIIGDMIPKEQLAELTGTERDAQIIYLTDLFENSIATEAERAGMTVEDFVREKIGIASGDINRITPDDTVDLSLIFSEARMDEAVTNANNLSEEAKAAIMRNDATLDAYQDRNPTEMLTATRIDEILAGGVGSEATPRAEGTPAPTPENPALSTPSPEVAPEVVTAKLEAKIDDIYGREWWHFGSDQMYEWYGTPEQNIVGIKDMQITDIFQENFGEPFGNGLDSVESNNREQLLDYLNELRATGTEPQPSETTEEYIRRALGGPSTPPTPPASGEPTIYSA